MNRVFSSTRSNQDGPWRTATSRGSHSSLSRRMPERELAYRPAGRIDQHRAIEARLQRGHSHSSLRYRTPVEHTASVGTFYRDVRGNGTLKDPPLTPITRAPV